MFRQQRGLRRAWARLVPRAWLVVLAYLPAAAVAGDLRAPGFTWGEVRYPGSEQELERDDLVLEGAVTQGLDLLPLSDRSRLQLVGRLRYKTDSEGLDFNNKVVLAGGLRLQNQLSDNAAMGAGVVYEIDRRFRSNRNLDGFTVFIDGFASWQRECGSCAEGSLFAGRPLPGLMWAELRYPASHDPAEDDDLLLEAAVEQGIDWMRVGDHGTLNTFVSVDLQADTAGLDYYRSISSGLGVRLRFPFGRTGLLQLGLAYEVDHRWESRTTQDGLMAFLTWSASWNALPAPQALPLQAAPPQALPPQALPLQAAPPQAVPPQAAPPQAASEQQRRPAAADGASGGAEWIRAQPRNAFTIQVLGLLREQGVRDFLGQHPLERETAWFRTERNGSDWFVAIAGSYPNAEAARSAIASLPAELRRNQPWIRSFASVQDAIRDE